MSSTRGQSNFTTKFHHEREYARGKIDQDVNRNLKRAFGTIYQVDPNQKGTMLITAWIPRSGGGRRLWGNGREIVIIDSKEDIRQRFGDLKPGMIVEISWRGIDETSKGYARVIAEATNEETVRDGQKIPDRKVDTQSSLPFEPFGLL